MDGGWRNSTARGQPPVTSELPFSQPQLTCPVPRAYAYLLIHIWVSQSDVWSLVIRVRSAGNVTVITRNLPRNLR